MMALSARSSITEYLGVKIFDLIVRGVPLKEYQEVMLGIGTDGHFWPTRIATDSE